MSTIIDDFSNSATLQDNWNQITSGDIFRPWHIANEDSYYLRPVDPDSSLPTQGYGLILNDTPVDVNSTLTVKYKDMGIYNGDNNSIIFRCTDNDNYYAFHINPGTEDQSGVYITVDNLDQANPVDYFTDIVRITPTIPESGTVVLDILNDKLTVYIYDDNGIMTTSGYGTDNTHITSGYFGFGHSDAYDVNFGNPEYSVIAGGWDAITATDGGPLVLPPIITTFNVSNSPIVQGDSTDLSWTVNSGTDTTNVEIDNGVGIVSLTGLYTVSPSANTTYTMTATNINGYDIDSVDVVVVNTIPIIQDFHNDGPISEGDDATLFWETTDADTAIINTIGNVTPVSAGSISVNPTVTTEYIISAFDNHNHYATSSTSVEVYALPDIIDFTTTAPVCSGSDYTLSWSVSYNTVSAAISDIGSVTALPTGSITIPATTTTQYILSAFNVLGDYTTSNVISQVYTLPPNADAGNDVSAVSNGGSPVTIYFDGSGSSDPQFLNLDYDWKYQTSSFSNSVTSSYTFDTSGSHDVSLTVTNSCGLTSTDDVNVYISQINYPVAVATTDTPYIYQPQLVHLYGYDSYALTGYITSYTWTHNGIVISHDQNTTFNVVDDGDNIFELTVTDSNGLSDTTSITIYLDHTWELLADAGPDQTYCVPLYGVTNVILDGSNSAFVDVTVYSNTITWFEWDLSDFMVPNQSGYVYNNDTSVISASIDLVAPGTYTPILTVSGDIGVTDTDTVTINVSEKPIISLSDQTIQLPVGITNTTVTLNVSTNATNASYMWYSNGVVIGNTNPLSKTLNAGIYNITVIVTDMDTGCSSTTDAVIDIRSPYLQLNDFSISPDYYIGSGSDVDVDIHWDTTNTSYNIISYGLIGQPAISGTYTSVGTMTQTLHTGMYEFTISAFDNTGAYLTENRFGRYIMSNIPGTPTPTTFELCKSKDKYIKTYGIEEIRYSKDRFINIVDYLPDYIKRNEIGSVVSEFEDYLNEMYQGQHGYSVDENQIPVSMCQTSACGTFDIGNSYQLDDTYITNTYDMVGDVFIDNVCAGCDTSDRISILEKIFRLTDLFDPDLIPIDLIQFYAENLGYNVGINRESLSTNTDPQARELEQKRYLRFMVRNLPNWYKIKSTRSAIKILLYSFGLVGDFVYYYTNSYNELEGRQKFGSLCGDNDELMPVLNKDTSPEYKQCVYASFGDNEEYLDFINSKDMLLTDPPKTGTLYPEILLLLISANDVSATADIIKRYDDFVECYSNATTSDEITYEDIVSLKCNLTQFVNDSDKYNAMLNSISDDSESNWVMSKADNSSIFDNNINIEPDFFATPHFTLWIDIDKSSGSISSPEAKERREMIKDAVMSVKPINTVFQGIQLFFDSGVADMYVETYASFDEYTSDYNI